MVGATDTDLLTSTRVRINTRVHVCTRAVVRTILIADLHWPLLFRTQVDNELYVLRGPSEARRFKAEPWKYLGGPRPRGTVRLQDVAHVCCGPEGVGMPMPIVAVIGNSAAHSDALLAAMVENARTKLGAGSLAARAAMPARQRTVLELIAGFGEYLENLNSEGIVRPKPPKPKPKKKVDPSQSEGPGSSSGSTPSAAAANLDAGFGGIAEVPVEEDNECDVDDFAEEFERVRATGRGGFVNWSELPVRGMVELLRRDCYPTLVVPFLIDVSVTDTKQESKAGATASATTMTAAVSRGKQGLSAAERKARRRWGWVAERIQPALSVIRALNIHIFSPWVMQRGQLKMTTTRRLVMGLCASTVLETAAAPTHQNLMPVRSAEAQRLLELGYFKLSRFGFFCPVLAATKSELVCNVHHPVCFRGHVLFPSSEDARQKLLANALRYVDWSGTQGHFRQMESHRSKSGTASTPLTFVGRNVINTCAIVSATDGQYPTGSEYVSKSIHYRMRTQMASCRVLTRSHALRLAEPSASAAIAVPPCIQMVHVTIHGCIEWVLNLHSGKASTFDGTPSPDGTTPAFSHTPVVIREIGDRMRHFLNGKTHWNSEGGAIVSLYEFLRQHVPIRLLAEVIALRLRAADCRLRGWILVDYPRSASDAAALSALGIVPATVAALVPANWPTGDLVYENSNNSATAATIMTWAQGASSRSLTTHLEYRCALRQLESVCTYYASRYGDICCRLSLFNPDLSMKDELLRNLDERAYVFERDHPFVASMSPYFQLLKQKLDLKLAQRRAAAFAQK